MAADPNSDQTDDTEVVFRTDLSGKTAVVTGGSSGIGRQIALAFARHGANVVVADVDPTPRDAHRPTADVINDDLGADATFVECDVTKPDHVEAAMRAADALGGIDIMVNNAGIFRTQAYLDVTEEEYDTMADINVKSVFFAGQAAAKRMVVSGSGGTIINLSSVAGLKGSAPFSVYCMSKGAVRLLTMALAAELAPHGIRVNALHPGVIETAMTTTDVPIAAGDVGAEIASQVPMGRLGTPTDIAGAALFLASDLAQYVNGASLVVDGGAMRN